MRRSIAVACWLGAMVASCGGDPAERSGAAGNAGAIAGTAGSGGEIGASGGEVGGSGGVGGSDRVGGGGGVGGGGSESPHLDGGAAGPDAPSEAAVACPPGGTGFTVLGNAKDMVLDNATCLLWDRSHSALGFQESKQHCEDLTLGGYDDWRMPTVEELFSLVRRNNAGNIDAMAFPNAPGSCWTATQPDAMHSCAVGFDSGGCYKYGNSAGTWGTYCVRGTSTTLSPLSAACKMVCGI